MAYTMDRELHNQLRKRIRQVIAEKAGIAPVPEKEGGFLPLLAAAAPVVAPLAGKAMSWLGDKIFGSGDPAGMGKHGPGARTHNANEHAQQVGALMRKYKAAGTPLSLAEASKMVAGGEKPLRRSPRKHRAPKKHYQ